MVTFTVPVIVVLNALILTLLSVPLPPKSPADGLTAIAPLADVAVTLRLKAEVSTSLTVNGTTVNPAELPG
jgi:hypothetical protein